MKRHNSADSAKLIKKTGSDRAYLFIYLFNGIWEEKKYR